MTRSPVKVFLVDDSIIALTVLRRLLGSSPDVIVVGTALNAKAALNEIPKLNPDVICTDFHMADMNGLELTKQIMAMYPRPILVISASVQADDRHNVFQLLSAGAVDVFPKPVSGEAGDYESIRTDLINKVRLVAGVSVFTKRLQNSLPKPSLSNTSQYNSSFASATSFPKILAIGASTGGPQALHQILTNLPANFPVPIVCVQHISEGFLQGLVEWLSNDCRLRVRIAQPGELPLVGNIYFPPEKMHLEIDAQGRFKCTTTPPVDGHRPSVTATFESVARYYGKFAIAVLLTGMGRDGADGMLAVAQAGGVTIAQDEASSLVFGMPKEAIALGAAQNILPLDQIAPTLLAKVSTIRT